MIIKGRQKDLGGFAVRRVLPFATRRMVGPFIFFDHMGPAQLPAGKGMDVRPHPHINLATVTYLFTGKIRHQDSLGYDQVIEPGAVNWMTAGKGIVHSERTPEDERQRDMHLHGIQLWVALPEEHEEVPPSFSHHPKETLPEFQLNGAQVKILLGRVLGHQSPVPLHSDLFYAEVRLPSSVPFHFSSEGRESAIYLVEGSLEIDGQMLNAGDMWVAAGTGDLSVKALAASHFMVLGGHPVGERFIHWNFVSSSKERLQEAQIQWKNWPQESSRFHPIPGDAIEFTPLPSELPHTS